jgi:hypothetical protein
MFTVETHAGRLIEARIETLRTLDRAVAYSDALGHAVRESPGNERMILCADHRAVGIYPQPVADKLAALFGAMNQRLLRIALLVAPSNATLSMQLARIVREAKNADRRVFLVPAEAETFLGEVMTSPERTRLARFLQSDAPPSGRSRF